MGAGAPSHLFRVRQFPGATWRRSSSSSLAVPEFPARARVWLYLGFIRSTAHGGCSPDMQDAPWAGAAWISEASAGSGLTWSRVYRSATSSFSEPARRLPSRTWLRRARRASRASRDPEVPVSMASTRRAPSATRSPTSFPASSCRSAGLRRRPLCSSRSSPYMFLSARSCCGRRLTCRTLSRHSARLSTAHPLERRDGPLAWKRRAAARLRRVPCQLSGGGSEAQAVRGQRRRLHRFTGRCRRTSSHLDPTPPKRSAR